MVQRNLTGRTALVTGAGKRIGRAIALALADAGARVVVHYRSSAGEAEGVADEIRRKGVDAWTVRADLAVPEELDSLVASACEMSGGINILINSSSIFPSSAFESFTREQLSECIDVNAWAPLVLARHFARNTEGGHIVNLLDTRVTDYDWNHVAYHTSKCMLELFTRMMALRFAPGITVNAVAPGLILPPEGKDQSYLESLKDSLPLKRVGSTDEVARAVLYLVGAEFVTGQVIYVDGGRHVREGRIG